MNFALKIQNSRLKTFCITSWFTCSEIVEIIHGYLKLYTFQKEASAKTKDKSARLYFTWRAVHCVTIHWIMRLSSFYSDSVVHRSSWAADSHAATDPRITLHYRRFLAAFTGAGLRTLSWPIKTPVHTDPLYFINIDTIFSCMPSVVKIVFCLQVFRAKCLYAFFFRPMRAAYSAHFCPRFDHLPNIWWGATIVTFPVIHVSPAAVLEGTVLEPTVLWWTLQC